MGQLHPQDKEVKKTCQAITLSVQHDWKLFRFAFYANP